MPNVSELIKSGAVPDYHKESSQVDITIEQGRGPELTSSLTSIAAKLKEEEAVVAGSAPAPLHFIFVIDRSGSMSGSNLETAKAIVKFIFDQLRAQDFISIILFDNNQEILSLPIAGQMHHKYQKSAVETTLLDAVSTIQVGGSTNIVEGLAASARVICREDGQCHPEDIANSTIVFITDGLDDSLNSPHAAGAPPMTSAGTLLTHIKNTMKARYGCEHLPRIIPIGVGINYMEQLLIGIGREVLFQSTGFLHINSSAAVTDTEAALKEQVNPVRKQVALYLVYRDGRELSLSWGYLNSSKEKKMIIESSNLQSIYLIQNPDSEQKLIHRIVDAVPPTETLSFDDGLLKDYFLSECARIFTLLETGISEAQRNNEQVRIRELLHLYPKDYWCKYEDMLQGLVKMEEMYIKNSDLLTKRDPVHILEPSARYGLFGSYRDSTLRAASIMSVQVAGCASVRV